MTLLKKALILTFAVGMAAPLVGCAEKKPDGMPDLHPTTVTLTVDGKGLAEANVTLMPADSKLASGFPPALLTAPEKQKLKLLVSIAALLLEIIKLSSPPRKKLITAKTVHRRQGKTPQLSKIGAAKRILTVGNATLPSPSNTQMSQKLPSKLAFKQVKMLLISISEPQLETK